jgi:hypothetical protein
MPWNRDGKMARDACHIKSLRGSSNVKRITAAERRTTRRCERVFPLEKSRCALFSHISMSPAAKSVIFGACLGV